jgi:hypothetical protein
MRARASASDVKGGSAGDGIDIEEEADALAGEATEKVGDENDRPGDDRGGDVRRDEGDEGTAESAAASYSSNTKRSEKRTSHKTYDDRRNAMTVIMT